MKTAKINLRFLFFLAFICLVVKFSDAQTTNKAYGNNMKLVDSVLVGATYQYVFAIYSGDVNQDGTMDVSDFNVMEAQVAAFSTGYVTADINGDLVADVSDFNLLEANVSKFISVIHP